MCLSLCILLFTLILILPLFFLFFFFNDTATTEIYTLSLHDALPIFRHPAPQLEQCGRDRRLSVRRSGNRLDLDACGRQLVRSEEHTSELQSRLHLVCRLLLEKKKKREN